MPGEVPQLFDPVKLEMLKARIRQIVPERFLLDHVAADLDERLAALLRRFGSALDLGTPFQAFAKRVEILGYASTVDWADPLASHSELPDLELPDLEVPDLKATQRFDLITSGMLFQRINDLPGLLVRLRGMLNPDGLLLAAFPGGETLFELRDALITAESEIRGSAGLRIYPMIDLKSAGSLLQRAGFTLPVTDSEKIVVRYPHILSLMADLRAMGASAGLLNRKGTPGLSKAVISRAGEVYQERYADPDGKIRASFEIIWMSGWAAHESQQKPLKPGSAKRRLADALTVISVNGTEN